MDEKEMFQRILVAVDDSDDAQLAFEFAIKKAADIGAELYIVSILEPDDMNVYQVLSKDYIHGQRSELEEHIKSYVKRARAAGVAKVFPLVSEGKPGKVIVHAVIPEIKPSVLVIGSLAKKGPKKYMGSEAAYMAKYASISVLVVR